MDRYEIGLLAKSKAGHDAGKFFFLLDVDVTYVFLSYGRIRTLGHLKKKKKKHVQAICRKQDVAACDDVAIKRILKEFSKEEER